MIEYSKTYSKTTGIFWNYYRDEPNSGLGGADNNVNYSVKDSKSFDYKASITGKLEGNNTEKKVEIVVLLKHLSNFWRTLYMPLSNCEINLILTWSKNCVITNRARWEKTAGSSTDENTQFPEINNPTNTTFKITDTKLYVPVVALSTEDDNNFLEQLKSGFKRTIKWNNHRSEMTNQTKTNNWNYLIDPTFNEVNRLFVLLFENKEDRTSFWKYYTPKVEINDFNVLVDGKSFFGVPVKKKNRHMKKLEYLQK